VREIDYICMSEYNLSIFIYKPSSILDLSYMGDSKAVGVESILGYQVVLATFTKKYLLGGRMFEKLLRFV
jgi:hypothetical protein